MPDKEQIERASKIQEAIDAATAKRRADEERQGEALDKLLTKLDAVMDGVEHMKSRVDALESDRADAGKRDDIKRKRKADADDDDDDTKDDHHHDDADDPESFHEQPVQETKGDPTLARQVVADTHASRADAERDREFQCYEVMDRLSPVADAWGQKLPAPYTGERPENLRVRLLSKFQRFSPDWKNVDLRKIRDPKIMDAAEARIRSDAIASSNSPDVSPGTLRAKTVMNGAHQITTFYGSPSVWLDEAAGNRMRRYVSRINPKATTE
jgi:colicin import membrane protein